MSDYAVGTALVPPARPPLDEESAAWLRDLADPGPIRDQAIRRLHALLLRAAAFEVTRRRTALRHLTAGEASDLATQCADDAVVAVLRKLDGYRGASRFTTWAYKFAILEVSVAVRRRAWQDREVPWEVGWEPTQQRPAGGPEQLAVATELADVIRRAVDERLTPHQRRVLIAAAVTGVPIDVLAERLGTTRAAVYKTLHDARRRVRAAVVAAGYADSLPGGAP